MSNFRRLGCLIYLALTVTTLNAQNFDEILNRVNNYYTEAAVYNIASTYTMFRGYTGTNITEQYDGVMYKKNDVIGMKAIEAEIIAFPDVQLTISNKKKLITYTKKKSTKENVIDVTSILKFYDQTATREEGNTLIYEISLKKGAINIPYNKLIFYINKKNFSLLKQEFFFTSKLPFIDDSGKLENDYGRMAITYSDKASSLDREIKAEDYFITNRDGTVRLSKTYENYQLVNQTPYN